MCSVAFIPRRTNLKQRNKKCPKYLAQQIFVAFFSVTTHFYTLPSPSIPQVRHKTSHFSHWNKIFSCPAISMNAALVHVRVVRILSIRYTWKYLNNYSNVVINIYVPRCEYIGQKINKNKS